MAAIFESGWENAPGAGSSSENLTDNGAWGEPGGQGGAIVDTFAHSGQKCLQVTLIPDGSVNGPDFRIPVPTFEPTTLLLCRWLVYFSSNYHFRTSDHKMVILARHGDTQDIYLQLRGNPGNTTAKLAAHVLIGNGGAHVWESSNITIHRGQWNLFEARIRLDGAINPIEYKANGVVATMVAVSGGPDWTSELHVGTEGLRDFKLDTTYNGFDDPAVQAAAPFVLWFDDVALDDADAPGSPEGDGDTDPPEVSPETPSSPTSTQRAFRIRAQAIIVPRGEAVTIPINVEQGSPAPAMLFTLASARNSTTKLWSTTTFDEATGGYLVTVPAAQTNLAPGKYWWDVWDTETPRLLAIGSLEIHGVVRLP